MHISTTPEEHAQFKIAAIKSGKTLQEWAREILNRAVEPTTAVGKPPVPTSYEGFNFTATTNEG